MYTYTLVALYYVYTPSIGSLSPIFPLFFLLPAPLPLLYLHYIRSLCIDDIPSASYIHINIIYGLCACVICPSKTGVRTCRHLMQTYKWSRLLRSAQYWRIRIEVQHPRDLWYWSIMYWYAPKGRETIGTLGWAGRRNLFSARLETGWDRSDKRKKAGTMGSIYALIGPEKKGNGRGMTTKNEDILISWLNGSLEDF